MHISRIKIKDFRNLKDVEINFLKTCELPDGEVKVLKSHAIIGQNGSGKSNFIEAIVTIFRDLDLNQKTEFKYELDYSCRDHVIYISTLDVDKPTVSIVEKGEKKAKSYALSYLSRSEGEGENYIDNSRKYLPSHVFAYYSGKNERIESLFQTHQERFYDALLNNKDELLRKLFYCRNVHSQFVLLAYLLEEDEECKRILSDLNIESLESVLFTLKKPYWFKRDMSEEIILNGDNRFWYARGVVQDFLGKLWDVAVAPIETTVNRLLDYRGRKETQDLLYLFVKDKNALKQLSETVGEPSRFFKYLESTYISDLIDEVKINVKHRDVEGNLNFGQLSEGEQQLLTVLGLMRFTHEDESLFLLDEPDTHLNPIWKLRYFDEIERVVKLQDKTSTGDSQLILATHDPMMVGSLRKEQVRMLRKYKGETTVHEPEEHPQGMGFAGLLKSELFGLRSTVDSETLRRLDKRNYLFALGRKRTQTQNQELAQLSDELSDLGFSSDFKDPYFEMFVKKMAIHTKFHKETLTVDEQKEQDQIADEIIDEILKQEQFQ
jgi:predicted ATPase